jgi:predicted DsbA family dithiol-disulfide isomerase
MNHPPLSIQVLSDIVCPWCYIGKRRMEAALALFAQAHPEQPTPHVSWLPFQLNPDMPPSGMSRQDYLLRKFGQADGGDRYAHVKAEGLKEGLSFAFERVARMPNTLKAHALIAAAHEEATGGSAALQGQVKEALMRAFFMDCLDMTSDANLLDISVAAGMQRAVAQKALQDAEQHAAIASQDAELRRIGIHGVPFFILNLKFGLSGAQPPSELLSAMEQALADAKASVAASAAAA